MASSRVGVVTTGPYRWVRHPNYVAVVAELFALPMIHTAWITALVGTIANLEILRRRLAVEDGVLMANLVYRATMGSKPRFLPRMFKRRPITPRREGAG
jgi:isoprenylcysteine carboxyl methyltransferase (ICMT) family protein YpbQ